MYLADLSSSLLGYTILFFSLWGWGRTVAIGLKITLPSDVPPFAEVWLGWALSLVLLSLLHLFVPLSAAVSFCLYGGGVILLWYWRDGALLSLIKERPLPSLLFMVLLALVSVWFASRGMSDTPFYDSGLYYLNSVRWLNEYPMVKGLGNLHGRLAFNQSFFAYVASLNLFPWFGHGRNIALSFLVVLLLGQCLWHFVSFLFGTMKGEKCDLESFVAILFIPVIIRISNEAKLASASAGLASSLLQILLFLYLIRSLQGYIQGRESTVSVKMIVLLGVTAITLKLSNIMYASSIIGISLGVYFLTKPLRLTVKFARILTTLLVALAVLLLWIYRGILLSGCPLYPSTLLCVDTEWSIPLQRVQDMANWIHSWARQPGRHWKEVLGNWNWLSPWFDMIVTRRAVVYSAGLTVLGGLTTWVVLKRSSPERRHSLQPLFLSLLPPLMSIVFWFFMAPDPRFAGSFFYILPIASLLPLIAYLIQYGGGRGQLVLLVLFVVLNLHTISSLYQGLRRPPFTNNGIGYVPLPVRDLKTVRTWSGLEVFLPVQGDQCFDSPLPATQQLNPRLHLLGKGLGSGFSVLEDKKVKGGAP